MSCLQTAGAFAGTSVETWSPGPTTGQNVLIEQFVAGLESSDRDVFLVLDDLHELKSDEAVRGLKLLLDTAPARFHLLISTRRDPPIGLHLLRVAGLVTEIRAADLAFDADEARELLSSVGVELTEEDLGRLCHRTEGWAAGLRLAAMSLVGRDDPGGFVAEFSGSERTVAGYLLAEVLGRQPDDVRELLLRTSIVDRMNGQLVEVLTGRTDGERVLQELEDAGAFVVSVDVGRSWFRYHHLLADLLRLELRRTAPHEIDELHRAAARWYGEHGFPLDAIRHAQAGQDWEYATEQIAENWINLGLNGEQTSVRALLAAFPAELVQSDAELALLTAWERTLGGRWEELDAYIALSDRLADSLDARRRRRFDLTVTLVKLGRARRRGDFEAVVDGARAIFSSEESSVEVISNDDVRLMALVNLGIAELWSLRFQAAERHLGDGLALAHKIERPYLGISCLGHLAVVAQMTQRLEPAKQRAREAIELAERLGWAEEPFVGAAYMTLGAVLVDQGRTEEGSEWLEQAEHVLRDVPEPATSVALHWSRAMVRLRYGAYDEAIRCYHAAELAHEPLRSRNFISSSLQAWTARALIWLGDLDDARGLLEEAGDKTRTDTQWCNAAAYLHLADGDPEAALDALTPVSNGAAATFHFNLEIEALLLEALTRDRLGDADASERALEAALQLAERERRVWIMTVVPVRELLERHPRHRTRHAAFLAEILADVSRGSPAVPHAPPELSDRELSVLGYLPTNLSANEIASELFLSVHTVKTHMRHIYAKLKAHRRKEAVEQARSLGLLAPPASRSPAHPS